MRKTIISIAFISAAFLSASCQKEKVLESDTLNQNATQFTASIESLGNTKTTVERVTSPSIAYKTYWESTDLIKINGAIYQAVPDGTDATQAKFTYQSGDTLSGTYKAYFPASIYDGTTATLPASYTYEAGKYNMPMYAESSTTYLPFKNICSVLAVKVTSADISTLKAIKVKSDKAMNGAFTISDNKAVLTDSLDASKAVTLTASGEAMTLDTAGVTFYIAIPAQTYSYLEIYVSSDGSSFTQMMCTKSNSGLGTMKRNAVYPIDYAVNAVQLWADGPFWATTNIGAANSTDYGRYFAWGDVSGQEWKGSAWSGSGFSSVPSGVSVTDNKLNSQSDAATRNWGSGWSMPTKDDFDKLISNCTDSYADSGYTGVTFTGKDGYISNSIFLPAAGYGGKSTRPSAGDYGYYWSSEQRGTGSVDINYAYSLCVEVYWEDWYTKSSVRENGEKFSGYSVRPVRSSL